MRTIPGVFILLVLTMAAVAAQQPAPHNLVGFDLKPYAPKPQAGAFPQEFAQFLDTASVRHSGDTVSFDILQLSASSGPLPRQDVEHREASCGWRTTGWPSLHTEEFLAADDNTNLLVDQACATGSVSPAQGYRDGNAAASAWKETLAFPQQTPGVAAVMAHSKPQPVLPS